MLNKPLSKIIALTGALVALFLFSPTTSRAGVDKTAICHADSAGKYEYLELPPAALDAHFDEHGTPLAGHEKDFFSVDGDCDKDNDPTPTPPDTGGGGTTPSPEPLTILLFGAGLSGIGYASRRFLGRNKE